MNIKLGSSEDLTITTKSSAIVTVPNATGTLELQSNKVTSISSSSTDTEYPSAKCVYDAIAAGGGGGGGSIEYYTNNEVDTI